MAHMAGAACLVAEAAELVEGLAFQAAEKYASQKEGGLAVSMGILDEKPIIGKSLLHKALSEAAGGSRDITELHVQQLFGLFGKQPGKMLDLPYGVRAERVYEGILLKKREFVPGHFFPVEEKESRTREQHLPAEEAGSPKGQVWELPINGALRIPAFGYEIHTRILENQFQNEEIPKKMYTKWMDYDRIKGNMHLRTRQEQDYFVISPDGRQKKLKRYFIDEKVPRQQRGQVLLLAEGAHVLWAIGGRISEDVKVTKETQRVLEIQVYGGNVHE